MGKSYKIGKWEASLGVILQLAVAAVLVVVSLFIGWISFTKWRFKVNLTEGFASYDQGQLSVAKPALQAALKWREDHAIARELLAAIQCDGEEFGLAESNYKKLDQGSATVRAGLGVIYLRKADAAATPADAAALVKVAQDHFGAARSIPEGQIGLGHCDLLLARRFNDPKRFAAARAAFEGVRKLFSTSSEARAGLTRGGAVDYYLGLGTVLSKDEKTLSEAGAAYISAYQYNYLSRWVTPLANRVQAVAGRVQDLVDDPAGYEREKKDILKLHDEVRSQWKNAREGMGALKEPWLLLTIGLAHASAVAGDLASLDTLSKEAKDASGAQQHDVFLRDSAFRAEVAMKDALEQTPQFNFNKSATNALEGVEGRIKGEASLKEARARNLNSLAWIKAWRGAFEPDPRLTRAAIEHLKEALKVFPDDYVYNRNVLVLMKRLKPPPLKKDIEPFLEKARAASAGAHAEDFAEIEKYLNAP